MCEQDDPSSRDPVMLENGVTYCFIQHNNVYLMISSKHNCNAASMLLFLHKTVEVRIAFSLESRESYCFDIVAIFKHHKIFPLFFV